jgi:hypothetical protein
MKCDKNTNNDLVSRGYCQASPRDGYPPRPRRLDGCLTIQTGWQLRNDYISHRLVESENLFILDIGMDLRQLVLQGGH